MPPDRALFERRFEACFARVYALAARRVCGREAAEHLTEAILLRCTGELADSGSSDSAVLLRVFAETRRTLLAQGPAPSPPTRTR
ncbi:MAG: hypothetical protein MJE66_07055 [Proteobacteria bacterium]|nr:hypothetical protein [Pseudomonadota bacterium]